MKISKWKAKIQAMLRPAQHEHSPASSHTHALAAGTDRKPVEISIISTGERFVHVPSPEGAAEHRNLSAEAHYYDEREQAAAKGLERWDGKSVRDIDAERFYDHPHLETHTALHASVPEQARAEFWNPAPKEPAYRSSITVLAVDQLGEALVKEYVVDDSRNAEGWSYSVMSADRAAQLLHEYGATADLTLDVADALWDGSLPVQPAAIGATYRGPILSIRGENAYQIVGDEIAIEHKLGTLAIENPHHYVGQEVEICYPCGKVGLLRRVDALALEAAALQKPGAEKSAGAFER